MNLLNSKSHPTVFIVSIGAAFLGGILMNAPAAASAPSHSPASAVATVFATGLVNPRGLTFGPDGKLYVAEGGYPVAPMTEAPAGLGGRCSAGASGPGDYFGSPTGSRISRINAKGHVETFVDGRGSAGD
jgi:hypothetical protein